MIKSILILFYIIFIGNVFGQDQDFLNHLPDYIENTSVFQLGQKEARAYYIPEQHLSLNGNWKFYYSDTPEGVPSGFYELLPRR